MHRPLLTLAAVVAAVAIPTNALAAVTQSAVTAPADRTVLDGSSTHPVTIDGTTNGVIGDHVRLDCWSISDGAWTSKNVATNVALRPDGSFHYVGGLEDGADVVDRTCLLVASDQTTGPTRPQPGVTGPRLSIALSLQSVILSGPNLGLMDGVTFDAPTALGDFGVQDVGECGFNLAQLTVGYYTFGAPLFTCGAGLAGADPSHTLSEIQIDGANAYSAGALGSLTATKQVIGFPNLDMTRTLTDAGLSVFDEHDGFVTCAPGDATPPTNASCATLATAGVRLVRTTIQGNGGLRLTVTDRWESTGAAHTIDLLYEDAVAATSPTFRASWQAIAPTTHQGGDSTRGPAGPGTLFIDSSAADSADILNPQGAITWTQPPSQITWTGARGITEAYHRVIPAGGSVTITRTFDIAASRDALLSAARASLDALTAPTLTASVRPRTRSTYLVITGRATDLVGVARVTVGGHLVALDASGSFRILIAVKRGPHTITVVARDAAGNTTTRTLHARRY